MSAQEQMLEQFVAYLVDRLRGAGVFSDRQPSTNVHETEAYIGTSDRWLLHLVVSGPRVILSALDPATCAWQDHNIDSLADLDACFPGIAAAARDVMRQLTVYSLEKGRRYRIARDFTDFFGNCFAAGEELVFESRDFLPYEDGHTLHFKGRGMWIKGGSEPYARFGLLVEPAD